MRPGEFVLVAGPNGSGKSTVADKYIEVPEDRIRERWVRSMDNLPWFAARADRLVVVDNSSKELKVLALRHLGGVLELRDAAHPASERLRPFAGAEVIR